LCLPWLLDGKFYLHLIFILQIKSFWISNLLNG
jgi:hypothetical protein